MTRFLLATASVHTTAAACDYLTERLGPEDEVHVLTVREPESEGRDAADAANVASVRLAGADVRTAEREGEPAAGILAHADAVDADELLLAIHGGPPGAEPEVVGSTTRRVLAESDRPVVVVPLA